MVLAAVGGARAGRGLACFALKTARRSRRESSLEAAPPAFVLPSFSSVVLFCRALCRRSRSARISNRRRFFSSISERTLLVALVAEGIVLSVAGVAAVAVDAELSLVKGAVVVVVSAAIGATSCPAVADAEAVLSTASLWTTAGGTLEVAFEGLLLVAGCGFSRDIATAAWSIVVSPRSQSPLVVSSSSAAGDDVNESAVSEAGFFGDGS